MPPWYLGRPPLPTSRRGKEREVITNGPFIASALPQDSLNAASLFAFTTSGLSLSAAKTRPKPHSRHQEDNRARLVFLFFFLNRRHFAVVRNLERIKNNAGRLFSNAGKKQNTSGLFVFAAREKLQRNKT